MDKKTATDFSFEKVLLDEVINTADSLKQEVNSHCLPCQERRHLLWLKNLAPVDT